MLRIRVVPASDEDCQGAQLLMSLHPHLPSPFVRDLLVLYQDGDFADVLTANRNLVHTATVVEDRTPHAMRPTLVAVLVSDAVNAVALALQDVLQAEDVCHACDVVRDSLVADEHGLLMCAVCQVLHRGTEVDRCRPD